MHPGEEHKLWIQVLVLLFTIRMDLDKFLNSSVLVSSLLHEDGNGG